MNIIENLLVGVIKDLLRHLPDSIHDEDESWNWGWEELSDEAQESVKNVRTMTQAVLKKPFNNTPK